MICCNCPLFLPYSFFLYNGSESFSFYIARKSAMPVDALFASFVYSTLPKRISLFRLPGISNKKIRILLTSLFTRIYRIWFSLFFYNYNRNERIMLKSRTVCKSKDWRSVLEYTKNIQIPDVIISSFLIFIIWHFIIQDSFLIIYWIIHKTGSQGLYFPWNSDSRE